MKPTFNSQELIKKYNLDLQVLTSLEDKARGYQYADKPDLGTGLLFSYDIPQKVSFHMNNVSFPLFIVFFDKDWAVLHTEIMEPFIGTSNPQMPISYAIECNLGDINLSWELDHLNIKKIKDQYGVMGDGVRLCVIDSGVDVSHPSLSNKNIESYTFTNEKGDEYGHGTWVCGKILGEGVGVSPNCKVVSAKVLNSEGMGSDLFLNRALDWALTEKFHIINISFGRHDVLNPYQEKICASIFEQGGIVIAASGNSDPDKKIYPACYKNVISVSAYDQYGKNALPTNYTQIYAPGVSCLSTHLDRNFKVLSGSSMATAVISGLVSLGISYILKIKGSYGIEDRNLIINALRSQKNSNTDGLKFMEFIHKEIGTLNKNTVNACLICKNEKSNIGQLVETLCSVLEEVHITDTGSTDGTLEILTNLQEKYSNLFVHHFDWIDDFSAARNYSFSHGKSEWVFWVDCDDVVNPDDLLKFKNEVLIKPTVDVWNLQYVYGPTVTLFRERFIRRSIVHYWKCAIHEYVHTETNKKEDYYGLKIIHNHVGKVREDGRNLRILEKEFSKNPDNDRMSFYYGRDLFDAGNKTKAKEVLEHYVGLPCWKWYEDEIKARFLLSQMYLDEKEYTKSLKMIEPVYHLDSSRRRAEYYYTFGKVERVLGNLSVAAEWFTRCLCTPPKNGNICHAYWTNLPLFELVLCYRDLGLWDKVSEYKEKLKNYGYKNIISEVSSYVLHPKPTASTKSVGIEFGTNLFEASWKVGKDALLVNTCGFCKFEANNWVLNKKFPFVDASIDYIAVDPTQFKETPTSEFLRLLKPKGILWSTAPLENVEEGFDKTEVDGLVKYMRKTYKVAAGFTTCRRPDFFNRAYHSFKLRCLDESTIEDIYVVDDFSPIEDLNKMKRTAPSTIFLTKEDNEKGHVKSINTLIREVLDKGYEYLVFMEDDFLFIRDNNLITRSINILNKDSRIGQVIFNKSYSESDCVEESERLAFSGEEIFNKNGELEYLVHDWKVMDGVEWKKFHDESKKPSHAHWPNFSLNNGIWNLKAIRDVGLFDEQDNFEFNYAVKFSEKGYRTAFFPEINCIHLGKPRRGILRENPDLFEDMIKRHNIKLENNESAYVLNHTNR